MERHFHSMSFTTSTRGQDRWGLGWALGGDVQRKGSGESSCQFAQTQITPLHSSLHTITNIIARLPVNITDITQKKNYSYNYAAYYLYTAIDK